MILKENAVLLVLVGALTGCVQEGIDQPEEFVSLDENFFRCNVQPVIAARCSFMACHGNDERPLKLYAEQRYRLGISWDDYETPLTEDELAANFRMVGGFIGRDGSDQNLFLEKPLDTRVGGLFHRGKDLYGDDDVFLDRQDVGYQAIRAFSGGAVAQPDCAATEEVGQ
tara:strand:+ start:4896 stop:5402 length:507 start_codon:yes stop_codon:yes gene_type:complete